MAKKYKIEIIMAIEMDPDMINEVENKVFSTEEEAMEYLHYLEGIDGGLEANIIEIEDLSGEDMIEELVKMNS